MNRKEALFKLGGALRSVGGALRRAARSTGGAVAGAARRHGLLVMLLTGAALLIAAELLVLREIRAVLVVPEGGTLRGGPQHGYALGVIGVAMLPMIYGAVHGGSRPAAVALLALSLVATAIVTLKDVPELGETGIIGQTYDLAESRPAAGFWAEATGVLMTLAGSLIALRRNGRNQSPPRSRRSVPARTPVAARAASREPSRRD